MIGAVLVISDWTAQSPTYNRLTSDSLISLQMPDHLPYNAHA